MSETAMRPELNVVPSDVFSELEYLKAQKLQLEQKINEIHTETRDEALRTVKELCKQFDFTAATIGLAPGSIGAGKKGWFSRGPKKSAFVVTRSK
jgi:hypothetical protein